MPMARSILGTRFGVVTNVFKGFKNGREGVIVSEVGKPVKSFLSCLLTSGEVLPRLPFLHKSQNFDFVVGSKN
jgi:hypothetical protein